MSRCEVQRRNSNRWPRYVDQPFHLSNCVYCQNERNKYMEEVRSYHSNVFSRTVNQLGNVPNISDYEMQQQLIEQRYQELLQKQTIEDQRREREERKRIKREMQYAEPVNPVQSVSSRKSYRQYPIYDLITLRQQWTVRVGSGGQADLGTNWRTIDMKKERDREVTVNEIATLTTRDPKVLENSGLDRYEYRTIKQIINTHNQESDIRNVQYHWRLAGVMVGETYFIDDVKSGWSCTYDVDDLCDDFQQKNEMQEGDKKDGGDDEDDGEEVKLTRKVQVVVKRIWIDRSMDNMSMAANHNGAIPVWLTWPMPPASVEDKIIAKWKKRVKAAERMRHDQHWAQLHNTAGQGVARSRSIRSGSSRHHIYIGNSQRSSRSSKPSTGYIQPSSRAGSSLRPERRYWGSTYPQHHTSHHSSHYSVTSSSYHYQHTASSQLGLTAAMTPSAAPSFSRVGSSGSVLGSQRSTQQYNNSQWSQHSQHSRHQFVNQDLPSVISWETANSTAATIGATRNQSSRSMGFTFNGLNYHISPSLNDDNRL